jgi:hypothetical protein
MGAYADLTNVKALLLAREGFNQGGRRIDFSETYRNLRTNPNSPSYVADSATAIRLRRIQFEDTYAGYVNYELKFTDSTTFGAWMVPVPNEAKTPIGTWTILAPFTAVNPDDSRDLFLLSVADWSGTAQSDDEINWKSQSVISNTHAERIITQAEFLIDIWILGSKRVILANPLLNYFAVNPPVPPQIVTAAEYLSAFMIAELINPCKSLAESEYFMWWQRAKSIVALWIQTIRKRAPGWIARKPIVPISSYDKIGTPTLGFDMWWRQSERISFQDVLSRLRDYRKNVDYYGMVSQDTNFP